MPAPKEDAALLENAAGAGGVSLGKGAWDCDLNREILPEKEAEVFEEVATLDFPFEGIPTVPPRKDMTHMAFFCGGCRYRVTADPSWPVAKVKQALWQGGIRRANKPEDQRNTPGMQQWSDLALLYAGQVLADDKRMQDYSVPPGCQVLLAIEAAKLGAPPEPGSAYWN